MIVAMMNGLIGLCLSVGIGISYLGITWQEAVQSVFAANCAALLSLLLTLRAERFLRAIPWLNRSFKAWVFLAVIFLLISWSISPTLRIPRNLEWMFVPLVLSTGFSLILFGPIQDQFVRRNQRKQAKRNR